MRERESVNNQRYYHMVFGVSWGGRGGGGGGEELEGGEGERHREREWYVLD